MDKLFVIGDVHGEVTMLQTLLKYWDQTSEQLVILGDGIDRGENPLDVIRLFMKLQEAGAKIIKGNHEAMLLEWLDNPRENNHYLTNGGLVTIASLVENYQDMNNVFQLIRKIREDYQKEIAFLTELPLYYEWQQYLMVHAGVDSYLHDWRKTEDTVFYWVRESFYHAKNETGKTIIFGHTPTKLLNKNGSSAVWVSPCKTKIGIDGGAVYGGQLHGLKVDDHRISVVSVNPRQEVVETSLMEKQLT